MSNEFTVNSIFHLEIEKRKIEKEIRESKGIVPTVLYDKLDEIELKLLKMGA